jgi:imidazolonepropionase-like amidohydrolase
MADENRPDCDLAINNARIFDGDVLHNGLLSVGVTANQVTFVGASPPRAAKTIDAGGKFLMPGLIDCHLHILNMWTAVDEATMAADVKNELPKRLRALIAAGVTTVKSVGDSDEHILRLRESLANGDVEGPRLFTTGAAFAAPGSHPASTICRNNPWARKKWVIETDSPAEAREAVRLKAERKVDAIKVVHQGGCKCGEPYYFRAAALGADVQILRLEKPVLEAIIDEAHKHGIKVTVHTTDEDAAIEALEAGADGLEHGVTTAKLKSDRVIELLLKNRASYVPTLWLITLEAETAPIRYANLKRVADAGVRTPMGTDTFCGFGEFGANVLIEIDHCARAGIPALQILKMATRQAAEHLGAPELGNIKDGAQADLVLVDGDPSKDIGALKNIALVIRNGKIVVGSHSAANNR